MSWLDIRWASEAVLNLWLAWAVIVLTLWRTWPKKPPPYNPFRNEED